MVTPSTEIASWALACCCGVELSVTVTVKPVSPAMSGVPVMTPSGLSASPSGRSPPVTLHWSVPVPPEADSVVLGYVVPTAPLGTEKVVTLRPLPKLARVPRLVPVPWRR